MHCNRQSGDARREGKRTGTAMEDGRIVTDDFVHFVVHFAAQARGSRCDMCADDRPIRYS